MLVILKLETVDKSWAIHNEDGAFLVTAETVQLENAVVDEQGIRGKLVAMSGFDFPAVTNQIREYMNHKRHTFSYPPHPKPAEYRENLLWDTKTGNQVGQVRTLILDHLTIVYKE